MHWASTLVLILAVATSVSAACSHNPEGATEEEVKWCEQVMIIIKPKHQGTYGNSSSREKFCLWYMQSDHSPNKWRMYARLYELGFQLRPGKTDNLESVYPFYVYTDMDVYKQAKKICSPLSFDTLNQPKVRSTVNPWEQQDHTFASQGGNFQPYIRQTPAIRQPITPTDLKPTDFEIDIWNRLHIKNEKVLRTRRFIPELFVSLYEDLKRNKLDRNPVEVANAFWRAGYDILPGKPDNGIQVMENEVYLSLDLQNLAENIRKKHMDAAPNQSNVQSTRKMAKTRIQPNTLHGGISKPYIYRPKKSTRDRTSTIRQPITPTDLKRADFEIDTWNRLHRMFKDNGIPRSESCKPELFISLYKQIKHDGLAGNPVLVAMAFWHAGYDIRPGKPGDGIQVMDDVVYLGLDLQNRAENIYKRYMET